MERPRICAALTSADAQAAIDIEPMVDLFEVRMDLIGAGWPRLAGRLGKPWIACNRLESEGGSWRGSESDRIKELQKAVGLGAGLVDIELAAPGLAELLASVKPRTRCIISHHDLAGTPRPEKLREIVHRQRQAGADICKVVTTAGKFADNLAVLQLIEKFRETAIIAFVMGPLGQVSRVLCPLVGGDFTYASIGEGKESAPGQITVKELRKIYRMLGHE